MLTIKDLSQAQELDTAAMSAVRGGNKTVINGSFNGTSIGGDVTIGDNNVTGNGNVFGNGNVVGNTVRVNPGHHYGWF
jgi:NDP-sugar pyrophosphorylase family protein